MIASLKRALQPSVTDLDVDFDLPSGFNFVQSPAKVPTIFNGDKVTIYGVFKSNALSDDPLQAPVSGTATLKGKILGKPIERLIPFNIPASSLISTGDSLLEMPIVHQLASKSLIRDMQRDLDPNSSGSISDRKQEIINLSIESSVISSYTSYIAVDEDQDSPIEGAVKVWDVVATMAGQEQGTFVGYRLAAGGPPPPGSGGFGWSSVSGGLFGANGSGGGLQLGGASYGPCNFLTGAPAPSSSGLFGGPPPPSSGGLFGGPPPPSSGGLFGGPPPPSSGSLFGGPPPPSSSGLFGGPQPTNAGGLFGEPQTTGLFRAPQATGSFDRFGGAVPPPQHMVARGPPPPPAHSFRTYPQQAPVDLFASGPPPPPPAPGGSLFAGGPPPPPANNLFGVQSLSYSAGNIYHSIINLVLA